LSDVDQDLINNTAIGLLRRVGSVLDVGCGDGSLVAHFSRFGIHAVGVDTSPRAPAIKTRQAMARVPRTGSCEKADAHDLSGIESESFDAVTMVRTLHELSDPVRALKEARRVLKKGGLLLIADFLRGHAGERMWGERYSSLDEIVEMASRAGFEVVLTRRLPGEQFAFVLAKSTQTYD